MKASIIITTRNRRELLLNRSLPSALNQKFKDYEIIVVDDCSDDGTMELARMEQIKYIRNKKRMSLAYSRNEGVRQAKGEYIVWLDDDDELDINFLKETVPALDNNNNITGAVGVGRQVIYPEGITYQVPPKHPVFYHSIDDGFLIRQSVFDKIQNDESLPTDEDADFGLQFFKHFQLVVIDKPLMKKYGHPINNVFSYSHPNKWRLEGLEKFLAKDLWEFKRYPKEYEYMCRWAGRTFCMGKWYHKGLPLLQEALNTKKSIRNLLNYIMALLRIYPFYYYCEAKLSRYLRI